MQAVSDVSFSIGAGQTLGLVGESGSGKSTVGRCVLRLIEPTSGSVRFRGTELTTLDKERPARSAARDADRLPGSVRVARPADDDRRRSIAEPLVINKVPGDRQARVEELLSLVGLNRHHANRYPHEFSGGQRQRVGVARALALDPSVLVLDEPVSALDVSIQAGVVNLLEDLQERLGLAYLFIAHDLSVVQHISDTVAVMYLGKIVEVGVRRTTSTARPAIRTRRRCSRRCPMPNPKRERKRKRIVLEGDVPSPIDPPSGCRFRTRCWKAQDICATEEPALIDRGQGHPVACHFAEVAAEIV